MPIRRVEERLESDAVEAEIAEDSCFATITALTEEEKLPIEFAIRHLRQGIKKIRLSTKRRERWAQLCRNYKLTVLMPILDVPTRWSSTYNMLRRALQYKQVGTNN